MSNLHRTNRSVVFSLVLWNFVALVLEGIMVEPIGQREPESYSVPLVCLKRGGG